MKEQLDRAGAKVIGVVFNKMSLKHASSQGDYQYLAMYSPKYYSDYISHPTDEVPADDGSSKRLLDFFEYGELPPEVTSTVEKAVTAIKTQPRSLVGKARKNPKED
jgi:hypothetical protein